MTVIVCPRGGRRDAYHTDPDCGILKQASRTRRFDDVESVPWELEECKHCAGEVERSNGDRSIFEAALAAGKGGESA
jgi:hypothetical protein